MADSHTPSADRESQRAQTRGQHDLLIESLRAAAVSPESFDLPALLLRAASALSGWEAQAAAGEQLQQQLTDAEAFTKKYLAAIGDALDLTPLILMANAENNEENYADILVRLLKKRLSSSKAADDD